jgi:Protein of unknown function (DUF2924)
MKAEQNSKVGNLIALIDALDRTDCIDHWAEMFGRPPPKYLSTQFMKRVLIWETQNRAMGGVSAKTLRRLKKVASGNPVPAKAKPGSHLVREWNGRTYQVEVIDGGYVMDGNTWKSLSAIAKHITGAHWSGPRFFGVE